VDGAAVAVEEVLMVLTIGEFVAHAVPSWSSDCLSSLAADVGLDVAA
jgi:hypothetical protein